MRDVAHTRWVIFPVALVMVFGLHKKQDEQPTPVVMGSKNFTENRLLAEIMAQLIEAQTDIPVERRINLGGTAVVFAALQNEELDLYPEYTGTGWSIHLGITRRVSDPLEAYVTVADAFERDFGITWLKPFGFANSYAIAMSDAVAEELGISRISDLGEFADTLTAGVSHEFLSREDGYPGLAEWYDLDIRDLRGMEHGLAYEAIRTRRIDLVDTWTTDGKLLRYDIRILEDDLGFFPPYDAAPIVRSEVLDRYPELADVLNRLAFRIDDERMRELNYRVEEEGGTYAEVARSFLRGEGLTEGGNSRGMAGSSTDVGFFTFLWSRNPETLRLGAQHLWLTMIAVLIAIAVAVPLGIFLTRRADLSPPVMAAAGVIQTVPSLALLAFMIPVPGLGLGARSAIAALFLYAVLPILRNTYTGIREVDADLLEAARGMGLTDGQILRRVELPLAMRTVMAGIRTAAVISIGVATLAAFIGAGGLGDPILTGLQLNDVRLILSGAIPAAGLALVTDFALGRLERGLAPRGLS